MCRSSVRCPSDLPGVNPAINDMMILYYCLVTKVDPSEATVRYFPWRVVTPSGRLIGPSETTQEPADRKGRSDRVWGAVRPPPPGDQGIPRNSSSEHQNTP
jgi:hypothetical protein